MVGEINQEDWNGVYYDASVGEFYMIDVGDNTVTLQNPFTGEDVEDMGFLEFYDLDEEGSIYPVSEYVVQDPVRTVENLLNKASNSINGTNVTFQNYNPIDIDFAMQAVNLSVDDDALYHSVE